MSQASRHVWRPRWDGDNPPAVTPGSVVCFADLAGVSFQGVDLTGVEFFGCVLNGASFLGATLADTTFVGCFAGEHGDPVAIDAGPDRIAVVDSHVPAEGQQWPVPVAAAAEQAVTGNNVQRYQAAGELASLAYPKAGPLLAWSLNDTEWDVRSASVQALVALRGDAFPDGDDMIVRAVVEALGDENPIVSMYASEFVEAAAPPPELYDETIAGVWSTDVSRVLTALRTVVSLSRAGDPDGVVADTFDGRALLDLLRSPYGVVRAEYMHALGAADQYVREAWQTALRDEQQGVRVQALTAIRLLDDPPAGELAGLVEPLLSDPDETVRDEALFALGQLGRFDRDAVTAALDDPSEQVRQGAARLLGLDARPD
jgi:HEAT repeat protein